MTTTIDPTDTSRSSWANVLLQDRVFVQSGVEPRDVYAFSDDDHPGWNQPLTAADREHAARSEFGQLPFIAEFLRSGEYDPELQVECEAHYQATQALRRDGFALLRKILRATFPTGETAHLKRQPNDAEMYLDRVLTSDGDNLYRTGDELGIHTWTVVDLITDLGSMPTNTLERLVQSEHGLDGAETWWFRLDATRSTNRR